MTDVPGPDRAVTALVPLNTIQGDGVTQPHGAGNTLAFRNRQRRGHCIERPTDSLRPHPQYLELWEPIALPRVSRVSQQSGPIIEPLVITTDGTILDGHARWQVATERNQLTIPCLVYDVSQEESIEILIQRHRAAGGLNAYARILLALRLEAHLRKATASSGDTLIGSDRHSSNLTKRASRDVRQDIARIACVSTGNVTKVKQVLESVIPTIRERLLSGDVSIHRAWQWRTLNKKAQTDALWAHLNRRGITATIRQLVKSHAKSLPAQPIDIAPTIVKGLATCDLADLAVAVLDVPGRAVVVTRACYDEFRRRTDAAH
jgi:ParB-like chromosome segregation protein Spo0J